MADVVVSTLQVWFYVRPRVDVRVGGWSQVLWTWGPFVCYELEIWSCHNGMSTYGRCAVLLLVCVMDREEYTSDEIKLIECVTTLASGVDCLGTAVVAVSSSVE